MVKQAAYTLPLEDMVPQVRGLLQRLVTARFERDRDCLSPDEAPLPFLLREIDETVLPRELTVEFGDAEALSLIVSNRRLCALRVLRNGEVIQDLNAPSPQNFARLCIQTIQRCLARAPTVRFRPPSRLTKDPSSRLSCSARLLAQAAGIDFEKREMPSSTDVISKLKSLALAWRIYQRQDTPVEEYEPRELSDILTRTQTAALKLRSAKADRARFAALDQQCVLLPLNSQHTVALVHHRNALLLAVVDRDRESELAKLFCQV